MLYARVFDVVQGLVFITEIQGSAAVSSSRTAWTQDTRSTRSLVVLHLPIPMLLSSRLPVKLLLQQLHTRQTRLLCIPRASGGSPTTTTILNHPHILAIVPQFLIQAILDIQAHLRSIMELLSTEACLLLLLHNSNINNNNSLNMRNINTLLHILRCLCQGLRHHLWVLLSTSQTIEIYPPFPRSTDRVASIVAACQSPQCWEALLQRTESLSRHHLNILHLLQL